MYSLSSETSVGLFRSDINLGVSSVKRNMDEVQIVQLGWFNSISTFIQPFIRLLFHSSFFGYSFVRTCMHSFSAIMVLFFNILTWCLVLPMQEGLHIGQCNFSIHLCPLPVFQPCPTSPSITSRP